MTQTDTAAPQTSIDRASDTELVITRRFSAPPAAVFRAWATPELFQVWWVPKSFGLTIVSFTADIRTGGTYRLEMKPPGSDQAMAFFGRYLEVTPYSLLVWTNDEQGEGGAVNRVSFAEDEGGTLVTVRETYASKEALDEAVASGSSSGWNEQFAQLDAML